MKTKYWIIICIFYGIISFLAGKKFSPEKETVTYIAGKTIRDTVKIPVPVREIVPSDPVLIYSRDTIYADTGRVIIEKADTAAIIKDYITERMYAFNVYDDEYGSMTVDSLTVQYNRLAKFAYTRTPIQKVVTKTIKPTISPFTAIAYNTFKQASIQGGLIYHNKVITYRYIYDTENAKSGHEIGMGISF